MDEFSIINPSPPLAPYVNHYWTLKAGGKTPAGERTVPVGTVSLVFHRGGRMMSLRSNELHPRAFLSGVSTTYHDLQATGKVDMLVVVFKPFGAGAFLSDPLDEYMGSNVPLDECGDRQLKELGEKVLGEDDDNKAVEIIEKFLLGRLAGFRGYNHSRIFAALRMANTDAGANVASLSDTACLSNRQFNRIFSAGVGARPKEFLRIIRFQRALYTLQSDPAIGLAQLAYACGYYDQPHMIREFREFSGYTPTEYMAVCSPYSDYFSR